MAMPVAHARSSFAPIVKGRRGNRESDQRLSFLSLSLSPSPPIFPPVLRLFFFFRDGLARIKHRSGLYDRFRTTSSDMAHSQAVTALTCGIIFTFCVSLSSLFVATETARVGRVLPLHHPNAFDLHGDHELHRRATNESPRRFVRRSETIDEEGDGYALSTRRK
jgi:hypothetical protein